MVWLFPSIHFIFIIYQLNILDCSSTDMWGLGCLIWESLNGPLQQQSSLKMLENVSVLSR